MTPSARPRGRRGHQAAPAHAHDAQAGDAAGRAALPVVHARLAAPPRRRRGDPLLRLHVGRGAAGARRHLRGHAAALRDRGGAAGHGRPGAAGPRRGAARGAAAGAERRRAQRHGPRRRARRARAHGRPRHARADRGRRTPRATASSRPTPTARSRPSWRRPRGEVPTRRDQRGRLRARARSRGRHPAGRAVSFEREVFPALVGDGLYGWQAEGYWIDIGTPERYLEATYDLLGGRVEIGASRRATRRAR